MIPVCAEGPTNYPQWCNAAPVWPYVIIAFKRSLKSFLSVSIFQLTLKKPDKEKQDEPERTKLRETDSCA